MCIRKNRYLLSCVPHLSAARSLNWCRVQPRASPLPSPVRAAFQFTLPGGHRRPLAARGRHAGGPEFDDSGPRRRQGVGPSRQQDGRGCDDPGESQP
eukprot:2666543-Pyramimonas_sp.AAC.1